MKELDTLKQSPMFQLSLSSKELFHSNFLYWVYLQNKVAFREIIEYLFEHSDRPSSDEHREKFCVWGDDFLVFRENKHYDLCVTDSTKGRIYLIIENKVKSIPRLKQLKEYSESQEYSDKLLLSLSDNFIEKRSIRDDYKWYIADYGLLSEAIRTAISHHKINTYHDGLLNDYIQIIEIMHNIQKKWKVSPTDYFYSNATDFSELRIHDLMDKNRFSQMCLLLEEYLISYLDADILFGYEKHDIFENKYDHDKHPIYVNWGMTRAQGLLEAKIMIEDNVLLLIQVQGEQYRHCIELCGTRKSHAENWEYYSKYTNTKWFFKTDINETPFNRFVHSEPEFEIRPIKKPYNKYGDEFLYQYVKIPDNTTVKEVLENIVSDCKKILTHCR